MRLKSRTRKKIALFRFITSWIWLAVFVSFFVLKVLGNEVSGLPKGVLDKADKILEIPMRGDKESLNVSVAFGIAIFRLLYKYNKKYS